MKFRLRNQCIMLWRKYVVNAGISNCVANSGNKLATNMPILRNIYSVNASVPAPHLCQKTPLSCYEKVHLSNETLIHCLEICARLLHSQLSCQNLVCLHLSNEGLVHALKYTDDFAAMFWNLSHKEKMQINQNRHQLSLSMKYITHHKNQCHSY